MEQVLSIQKSHYLFIMIIQSSIQMKFQVFKSVEKIIFTNKDSNLSQNENLISIFNYIGDKHSSNLLKFDSQIISLEKGIFPKTVNTNKNLSVLWEKFNEELSPFS